MYVYHKQLFPLNISILSNISISYVSIESGDKTEHLSTVPMNLCRLLALLTMLVSATISYLCDSILTYQERASALCI